MARQLIFFFACYLIGDPRWKTNRIRDPRDKPSRILYTVLGSVEGTCICTCTYNLERNIFACISHVVDLDPGSCAFLTPGFRIRDKFFPDPGSNPNFLKPRGTDPRVLIGTWICTKMSRIRNTVFNCCSS